MTAQYKINVPDCAACEQKGCAVECRMFTQKHGASGFQVSLKEHVQLMIDVDDIAHGVWPEDAKSQAKLGEKLAKRFRKTVPEVVGAIARLTNDQIDALHIQNLPKSMLHASAISLAFTYLLGHAFNYDTQNDGALVMKLKPEPNAGPNTNATSSEFRHHTDDAAMPDGMRTHFITLYGVINPPGTETGYASSLRALRAVAKDALDSHYLDILSSPRFTVRYPTSFKLDEETWSAPCAIIEAAEEGGFLTRFPSYAVKPVDANDYEAHAAIAVFEAALRNHTDFCEVSAGTFLAFNNAKGAHCRGAIGDGDRLVLRTYGIRSLDTLRAMSGEDGPIFTLAKIITDRSD